MTSSSSSSTGVALHWFRKGLRLHDNPALAAAAESGMPIRPLFVLDPGFPDGSGTSRVGPNRRRFLHQSLVDLDNSLKKLGGRLLVARGKTEEVVPRLLKEWRVKMISFEADTEPYSEERDSKVRAAAKEAGVKVVEKVSHTIFNPGAVIKQNGGRPPLTYQGFLKVASALGPPKKEQGPDMKKLRSGLESMGQELMSDKSYDVPKLEELLGKDSYSSLGECLYPGGETEALARMDKYVSQANADWVRRFEKPNTSPNSIDPSTTVLSPHLKFGCLSARRFYWRLKEVEGKKKCSQPPVSLMGQMMWREFYYAAAAGTDNFHKMEGNPVCKQIDWDTNEEYLKAWSEARTGFPFIDAVMTQLRREGWIHHLARHSVACFLTRGDLYVSWEEGQRVFEELLLDADYALNAGNWMWLSASAFFHQYYRVYSPVAFGKKTDPTGEYIRKHLPVLKKFPSEHIYEPWRAPLSVQRSAGCVIGRDYPRPIVDHDEARKKNLQRMKAAYERGKRKGEEEEGGAGSRAKMGKKK